MRPCGFCPHVSVRPRFQPKSQRTLPDLECVIDRRQCDRGAVSSSFPLLLCEDERGLHCESTDWARDVPIHLWLQSPDRPGTGTALPPSTLHLHTVHRSPPCR